MSFQFYTNQHDNAPVLNDFDGFWEMMRNVMSSEGVFCYRSNAVNAYEVTVNEGANPCEKTIYLATNGTETINNIRLVKKDINTLLANKDLSSLGQNIEIRTDSSEFGWMVSYDDMLKKTKISNVHGSIVAHDNGHYVERGGVVSQKSSPNVATKIRYTVAFNSDFVLFLRDYADNSGAFNFFYSNEKLSCINNSTGGTILNIATTIIYGVSYDNKIVESKLNTVNKVDPAFTKGSYKDILLSEVNTDNFVIKNILSTITPFDIKDLIFGSMFFDDADHEYICIPNNYAPNFRYLTLRFKR